MKIEDLNKTQIVLLTLLTSFVTSIATGVVTVSLMDQAPPSVTQTINRVVERTVETVLPAVANVGSADTSAGGTVTKETTVVVKEEDLLTKSIENTNQSTVAVALHIVNAQGLAQNIFVGWGIIALQDGTVVTDSSIISDDGNYVVTTEDGMTFSTKVVSQNEALGIAILSPVREKDNEKSQKYTFKPIKFGDSNAVRLGQTIIVIGGKERKSVSVGVISGVVKASAVVGTSTPTTQNTSLIESALRPVGNVTGGPLINSFGEVIGLSIKGGFTDGGAAYTPSKFIKDSLNLK